MKTGYFYKLKQNKIDGAVSIAVGKPRYINVYHELKSLAPSWGLLSAFRKEEVTEEEYVIQFNAMLSGLNVNDIVDELHNKTGGEEPVIMCHCNAGSFCHRHLVAEWIERETGQVIEEFDVGAVRRVSGRIT